MWTGRHDPSTGLRVWVQRLTERGSIVVAEVNLIVAAVDAKPDRLARSALEVGFVEVVDERNDRALCHMFILTRSRRTSNKVMENTHQNRMKTWQFVAQRQARFGLSSI